MENTNFTSSNLPQMPEILIKTLEVIKNQEDVSKLIEEIEKDEELTKKMISLSNSNYFYENRGLSTIQKIITELGLMRVQNMLFAIVLKNLMTIGNSSKLWIHSIKCAVLSKILISKLNFMSEDDAFNIGFLHDIGKILLYKDESGLNSESIDITLYENEKFGTNHAMIGSSLMRKWRMPKAVVDIVKYHHMPSLSEFPMPSSIIHIADILVKDDSDIENEKSLLERIHLGEDDINSIKLEAINKSMILIDAINNYNH